MMENVRFVVRKMGAEYHGVWDTALKVWATWGVGYSAPMRFMTVVAAQTTADRLNRGIEKV